MTAVFRVKISGKIHHQEKKMHNTLHFQLPIETETKDFLFHYLALLLPQVGKFDYKHISYLIKSVHIIG